MHYWWVNQNQTYKHEVGGGYMWSPKKNADGGKNHFYINMTLVEPGDIVYSFCDTYIKAIGIVTNKAVSSTKPTEFGSSGANWNDDGWFVETDFQELSSPIKPSQNMSLILPTLPPKYSPLQANGNGNQVYLANVPESMAKVLNTLLGNQLAKILDSYEPSIVNEEVDEAEEHTIKQRTDIPETEKQQLVKSRRGQGLFRSRVEILENSCRITGLNKKSHLRASHIKPWSKSTDSEKLDGNNGLLLSPHVDHLFDRGYISFNDLGGILISKKLDPTVLQLWNIESDKNVGKFNVHQSNYLDYHRQNIFLK